MLIPLHTHDWLAHQAVPIIDVRSPCEFARGHIPGASLVPLFSDESRASVGTRYKQSGKEAAVKLGLSLVAPHLAELIAQCEHLSPSKILRIYCARGGMRSGSFAQMLHMLGYTVYVLTGGYKAYRAYVQSVFARPYRLTIISGKTGSGKTAIIHELELHNAQCIDLEGLARHKGSVFGALGEGAQPSQQIFENNLAAILSRFDITQKIWIEDESIKIGTLSIPSAFYQTMRNAPVIYLDVPRVLRITYLRSTYEHFGYALLGDCVQRLEKHLGNQRARDILERITRADPEALTLLLEYYDTLYERGLLRHPRSIQTIKIRETDFGATAKILLEIGE